MPRDITADAHIGVIPGEPVALPSHDFIANAQMTREGADLRLTLPDGNSLVVEGYFAQNPPPDLVAADGARLSPHLVDSFLTHAGQYAAAGNSANDASPAGKVTAVVGEAHIIRADGTHIPAIVGTLVHQGDVIETAKTGAVNIIFADNTAFAVSENARMSVDKFIYDSDQHNGATFFAMLQGAFVYTSGLIGKTDPGNVNIETPVGTIGIRGTAFAGALYDDAWHKAGHKNVLALWDGAGYLHSNTAGLYELNHKFQTLGFGADNSFEPQKDIDPAAFMRAHPELDKVTDDPWRNDLYKTYHLLHPDHLHLQHDLQMPPPHEGLLLHPDRDTDQAWAVTDPLHLSGGVYTAWSGNFQALSPFPMSGKVFPPPLAAGSNGDDIFRINSANTALDPGPESTPKTSVFFDGGNGNDTVIVGDKNVFHINFDLIATHDWQVLNVENIVFTTAGGPFGNHGLFSLDGVEAVTDSNHILHVEAQASDKLTTFIDVQFTDGGPAGVFSTKVVGANATTYTGVDSTGTTTVTLVVATHGVTPTVIAEV